MFFLSFFFIFHWNWYGGPSGSLSLAHHARDPFFSFLRNCCCCYSLLLLFSRCVSPHTMHYTILYILCICAFFFFCFFIRGGENVRKLKQKRFNCATKNCVNLQFFNGAGSSMDKKHYHKKMQPMWHKKKTNQLMNSVFMELFIYICNELGELGSINKFQVRTYQNSSAVELCKRKIKRFSYECNRLQNSLIMLNI